MWSLTSEEVPLLMEQEVTASAKLRAGERGGAGEGELVMLREQLPV